MIRDKAQAAGHKISDATADARFARIQEVIVVTDAFANLLSFKYLLSYFALMAVLGASFIGLEVAAALPAATSRLSAWP